MALEKISQVRGRGVHVPGDDIDTDRIIPARFMKCVTFDGLGEFLFHDVRNTPEGIPVDHPLNDPRFTGARVLLSGNNFGCGSSREHAPQAIYRAGFRAVIAEGFAEIFFGNSIQLGMPCVTASREEIQSLASRIAADPALEITLDLEALKIRCGGGEFPCALRAGARQSLIEGRWDPIADLLENLPQVDATAARLPYLVVGS